MAKYRTGEKLALKIPYPMSGKRLRGSLRRRIEPLVGTRLLALALGGFVCTYLYILSTYL